MSRDDREDEARRPAFGAVVVEPLETSWIEWSGSGPSAAGAERVRRWLGGEARPTGRSPQAATRAQARRVVLVAGWLVADVDERGAIGTPFWLARTETPDPLDASALFAD